jgi:hypothetical protein
MSVAAMMLATGVIDTKSGPTLGDVLDMGWKDWLQVLIVSVLCVFGGWVLGGMPPFGFRP